MLEEPPSPSPHLPSRSPQPAAESRDRGWSSGAAPGQSPDRRRRHRLTAERRQEPGAPDTRATPECCWHDTASKTAHLHLNERKAHPRVTGLPRNPTGFPRNSGNADLVCAPVSNLKSSYSCRSQRPPPAQVVRTAGSNSLYPAASLSRGACPQQGPQLLMFPNQNQSWCDLPEDHGSTLDWSLQPQQLHKVLLTQPGLTRDSRPGKPAARKETHSNLIQSVFYIFPCKFILPYFLSLSTKKAESLKPLAKKIL